MKDSPYQANRVRSLLSKMMNVAKNWDGATIIPAREFQNSAKNGAIVGSRRRKLIAFATHSTGTQINLQRMQFG
jgi:hypothetical protein